jgi:hypothetical protein
MHDTTNKPRINITLEKSTVGILSRLAKKGPDKKSVASVARDLILEALEMREDLYLSKRSEAREHEGTVPYEKVAWK